MPNLRFPEFEGEWEETTFGDCCYSLEYGMNAPAKEYDGKNKYIRITDIDEETLTYKQNDIVSPNGKLEDKYLVKENDILWARTGASTGKAYLYDSNDGLMYYAGFLIRGNVKPSINSRFVFLQTQTLKYKKWVDIMSIRSGQPGINSQEYSSYKFLLPPLKIEQDKISSLFALLDNRIATQNRIIEKYESLIYGLLDSIVAYPKDNKKYKLGELCEIRSGYSGTQNQMCKGLRVSRIETISNHHINLDKVGYVEPFEKSKTYKLNIGDILFSNINSVEYIGNTAYIDKDYALYHGMNLLRLIPNKTLVNPFYIYCLLNTQRAKNHFKSVCNKAVSQASINQTELSKTPIFIPTISKQENIARLFDILLRKREIERNNLTLFQKQKAYLLKEMFV